MFASIITGLTSAAFSVFGKLVSQSLFEKIITKLSVSMLRKLAASTENKLDDEVVADVVAKLEADK